MRLRHTRHIATYHWCRCGDLGGRYRSVPSARRPWATFTCDSLIMSQSLKQLQKVDEIPPLLGCSALAQGHTRIALTLTHLKVATHVVDFEGQEVRAVQ